MATTKFGTSDSEVIRLEQSDKATQYKGLSGDDTYVISKFFSHKDVVITDNVGTSTIVFEDGVQVTKTEFLATGVKYTLSTGGDVTVVANNATTAKALKFAFGNFDSSKEDLAASLANTAVKSFEDTATFFGADPTTLTNDAPAVGTKTDVVINATEILNDTIPPVYKSAVVAADGGSITLTFDESIYVPQTAPASAFSVTVAGNKVVPTNLAVKDATVTLTLPVAISEKQDVVVDYTAPTAEVKATSTDAALQDFTGNNTASFSAKAPTVVNNSTVVADDIAPEFKTAEVSEDGRTVVLSFGEPLNAKTAAASTFSVLIDGAKAPVSDAVVKGSTVTLTLQKIAGTDQKVEVTYNAPTAFPTSSNAAIQDFVGNDALRFDAILAANKSTVDLKAPTLVSAEVSDSGTSVVLTYSEVLASALPATTAFTVKTGAVEPATTTMTVSNVVVDALGQTVTLTLSKPITSDQKIVTLSYDVITNDTLKDNAAVQDASGNDAVAVSNFAVVNKTSVPPPSILTSAATPDSLVLTSGDDIINGVVGNAPTTTSTLDGVDKIDGGANSTSAGDTLNVTMDNADFSGFTTGYLKNVENLNLTTTGARSFNATNATGINKINVDATAGTGITVSNLKAGASTVNLELASQKSGSLTVGYVNTGLTTQNVYDYGSDSQSVTLTNVGTAATSAGAIDVNIAKVETLDLKSAGATNFVKLANATDAATVKVSGIAATTVVDAPAKMTTFDARLSKGSVTADLSNATLISSIYGGEANDSLTVVADKLASTISIAGGTGTDKMVINSTAAASVTPAMSGIETIEVGTIAGDLSINQLSLSSELKQLTLSKDFAGAVSVFSPALTPALSNMTVQTNGSSTKAVSVDASGTMTLNYVADSATTTLGTSSDANASNFTFNRSEKVTLNVGSQVVASGTIELGKAKEEVALNVSGTNDLTSFTGTINAPIVDKFTVTAGGKLAGKIVAGSATTGTITTGTATSTFTADAARLTTLTVKNGGDLALASSTLTSLTTLTAVESGKLLTLPALPVAATVKVGGYLSTSAATFSTIGSSDSNSVTPLALTATGLMTGLTTGAINGGKANVSVDVTALMGTATIGSITASSKEVEIKASGASKQVTIDSITAGKVTVDATDAQTGFTLTNGITADTSVSYKGLNLKANTLTVTGSAASTALDVSLTGGVANDSFIINAGAKQTALTVSGDLKSGTNTVTVSLASATTAGVTANLSGVSSAVSISDSSGADTITGSVGNDTITSSLGGNDSITGGLGNDTFAITAGSSTITITDFNKGTDAISGSFSGAGTLKATLDDSSTTAVDFSAVLGSTGKGSITGGSANDTITGGSGADSISGGAGNDTITVGDGANVITVGAGTDTITDLGDVDKLSVVAGATASATVTAAWVAGSADNAGSIVIATAGFNVNMTSETGTGTVKITNSGAAATLIGGSGADTITASTGGDTLSGLVGNDSLVGGAGIDSITGGTGNDTITGGSGADVITVDVGTDTITDLGVADSLTVAASATASATVIAAWTAPAASNAGSVVITTAGFSVDMSSETGTGTVKITDNAVVAPTAVATLTGGLGADTITAGAFSDSITGGAGSDSLVGGASNDTISGGTDYDKISAGAGSDTIVFSDASDTIDGGAGTDTLTVDSASTATLSTDANLSSVENITANGNVILTGQAEGFVVTGSTATAGITITGGEGADTITGSSLDDTITGGSGIDVISTGTGANKLDYKLTADLVTSGALVDSITGGSGTDTLRVGTTGTSFAVLATDSWARAMALEEIIPVANTASVSIALNADAATAGIKKVDLTAVTASTGSKIDVSAYAATVGTTAAPVTLIGSAGSESIIGHSGVDSISAAAGNDTIISGLGNDTIDGSTGDDTFNFVAGTGLTTDDTVEGGTGNDTVALTSNTEILSANFTNVKNIETITVANTTADITLTTLDQLVAASSTLTLNASSLQSGATAALSGVLTFNGSIESDGTSAFIITGGADSDAITGGAGSDTISGGSGVDVIAGGAGSDVITGGAGSDVITDASGNDVYVFNTSDVVAGETLVDTIGTDTIKVVTSTNFTDLTTPTILTNAGIDQILITSGTTATFTGAQLTGQIITVNATSTPVTAANLAINVAASQTNTFANLVFTAASMAGETQDAFTTNVDTVTITVASGGSANVTGTTLADTITASAAGSVTVDGGSGNDTITSGTSADSIKGGAGADTLNAGTGTATDTLSYDDVSSSTAHGLTNINGMAINLSSASVTAATIATAAGGNVLGGGAGVAGADLAAGTVGYLATSAANSTLTMVRDTVSGFESVVGSALSDVIYGSTNADTITAGAGSDVIVGGGGSDSINAGDNDDTISFATPVTLLLASVDGGAGNDAIVFTTDGQLVVDADFARIVANSVEKLTLANGTNSVTLGASTGTNNAAAAFANLTVTGGTGNDTITVTSIGESVSIDGGAGSDNISASAQSDTIVGGEGNDTISGADGSDSITGGAGSDSITGGAASDSIDGGADDDTLVYLLQADLVASSAIVDSIVGGAGNDTLKIGTSGTTFTIATGDSWARVQTVEKIVAVANTETLSVTLNADAATAGITTVDISAGTKSSGNVVDASAYTATNITIVGSAAGSNTLTGGAFSDTITGGAASDTIVGGAGSDSIVGGAGSDDITGGTGIDTIDAGTGNDTIAMGSDGITSNAVIDSISGGDGTADAVTVGVNATAVTIANNDVWTRVSGVEKIVAVTNNAAVSISLDVTAQTQGITTVDIANGSAASGNVVDATEYTLTGITIVGAAGSNTLTGGTAGDTITGGAASDTIVGGAGSDNITAGAGSDGITGGTGNDTIDTGSADGKIDTLTWATGDGLDSITNFLQGVGGDQINAGISTGGAAGTVVSSADNSSALTLAGSDEILVLRTADGTFADLAAVHTRLEVASESIAVSDSYYVVWTATSGGLTHISKLTSGSVGTTATVDDVLEDIVVLVGTTDSTAITTANFAQIA